MDYKVKPCLKNKKQKKKKKTEIGLQESHHETLSQSSKRYSYRTTVRIQFSNDSLKPYCGSGGSGVLLVLTT